MRTRYWILLIVTIISLTVFYYLLQVVPVSDLADWMVWGNDLVAAYDAGDITYAGFLEALFGAPQAIYDFFYNLVISPN